MKIFLNLMFAIACLMVVVTFKKQFPLTSFAMAFGTLFFSMKSFVNFLNYFKL